MLNQPLPDRAAPALTAADAIGCATDLHRIIYGSRPALDAPAATAIRDILRRARRNNGRRGITGALLFTGDRFVQVLEGPAAAVRGTFERIAQDRRHSQITLLHAAPVEARAFAGWALGYNGALAEHRVEAAAFIEAALADPVRHTAPLLALLRRVMGRDAEWAEPIPPVTGAVRVGAADYAGALAVAD